MPLTPHDARNERGVKHLDSDDAREVVVEPDFPCPILACAEVPGELCLGATRAALLLRKPADDETADALHALAGGHRTAVDARERRDAVEVGGTRHATHDVRRPLVE